MPDTPVLWRAAQRVNLDTNGRVDTPHIIQLDNGRISVTYDYDELDGIPANGLTDVYARYFTQNGDGAFSSFGNEFASLEQREHRLNREWTNDHQEDHDIISLPNRGTGDLPASYYATVYEHNGNGNYSIRLEISGTNAITTSLTIVEDTDPANPVSSNPALAVSGDTIMVVYQHQTSDRNTDIYYRLYDLETGTLGPATLHLNFAGRNTDAQIATLLNGNFVTIAENDAFGGSIVFNITAPDGTVIVSTDAIASTEGNGQAEYDPQIAALANGGFVVAWEADVPSGTALRFEVFGSTGNSISGVTTFGNLASPDYDHISIAALDDGGFVIVTDDNAQNRGVMQRFDRFGNTVGDQVVIENTAGFTESDVMQLHDGRIAVSYQSADGEIYMAIYDIRDEASEGLSINDLNGVIIGHTGDNQSQLNGGILRDGRYLFGGPGDDFIYGSSSLLTFSQYLDGGAGNDTLFMTGVVNFVTGTANTEFGSLLANFVNIENFTGSGTVTGDHNDNIINMNNGDDWVSAGGGDDIVNMGDGDDTVSVSSNDSISGDFDQYDGEGGIDEIILSASAGQSWSIDLISGNLSYTNGYSATAVNFENVFSAVSDDTILGSNGANTLSSGAGDDIVIGRDGDDLIFGGSGVDELYGGGDDDTFYDFAAEDGKHIIDGNAGTDTWYIWSRDSSFGSAATGWTVNLATQFATDGTYDMLVYSIENVTGGNGDDDITGDNGNNILDGFGGQDTLDGGAGNDTLFGNAGNDILRGGTGVDSFDGGSGIDLIDYASSTSTFYLDTGLLFMQEGGAQESYTDIERFYFGSGNDYFDLTGGTFSEVHGGAGNDTFLYAVGQGIRTLNGGDGTDSLQLFSSTEMIINLGSGNILRADNLVVMSYIEDFENVTGTHLNDRINGSSANNTIDGLGGNDRIFGFDGSDTLRGREGTDELFGGNGIDFIYGGDDNDIVFGGEDGDFLFGDEGEDALNGENGNDYLYGGAGADALNGGTGLDTAVYGSSTTAVIVDLLSGTSSGGDAAGDSFSSIENVNGSAYDDTLSGDNGGNVLSGGNGNDTLEGRDGADSLFGGNGNDTIDGGDGEDYILGGSGDDTIFAGSGNDEITGGHGNDDINGGGGIDYAIFSGSSSNYTITDNGNGSFTVTHNFGGVDGSDTLTNVEYARFSDGDILLQSETNLTEGNDDYTGTSGDDIINGLGGNDIIRGLDGNDSLNGDNGADILIGGVGADILNGGDGLDSADYRGSGAAVQLNLETGGTGGDASGDSYVSIERVYGSNFNDVITGSSGNDFLFGEDGNDTINGGDGIDRIYGGDGNDIQRGDDGNDTLYGSAGNDQLNGGVGYDIASYVLAGSGVTVNMATGGTGGDAAGDTYFGIEAIYGSDFADSLTGNSSANELRGGDGDDTLIGSGGNDRLLGGFGADDLQGGTGTDIADYTVSTNAVTLNLISGGTGGEAAGDSYSSIEWVWGSEFDDNITGDDGNNRLEGRDGHDTISGGIGNDRILGGEGNDIIHGGDGVDTLFGQAGDDTLTGGDGNDFFFGDAGSDSHDGGGDFDTVSYLPSSSGVSLNMATGGTGGDAAGDSYVSIERIFGSSFADNIVGDGNDNTLLGNGGDDYLAGGGGSDSLFGGAGVDSFGYDTGSDGGDVINGFTTNELIYILGGDPAFDSWAEVQAVGTDVGANVIFNFGGGNTLTIIGQNLADLSAANFEFSNMPPSSEELDTGKGSTLVGDDIGDKEDIMVFEPVSHQEKLDVTVCDPWDDDASAPIAEALYAAMPIYEGYRFSLLTMLNPEDIDYIDMF